jgi:hypothetical protein
MMDVRRVPQLSPEDLAKIDEADLNLVKDVFKLGVEFAYHDKMVIDEDPFQYAITRCEKEQYYDLWFHYPKNAQPISYRQLSLVMGLGVYAGDRIDEESLATDVEHATGRHVLTVHVDMAKKHREERKVVKRKLIVETSMSFVSTSAIANAPDGVTVRRQQYGTNFSNSNSPRTNKRARIDAGFKE